MLRHELPLRSVDGRHADTTLRLVTLPEISAEVPLARAERPRAFIVTVYGLYAREAGGWLSVSSLIRLMAELGVDEPAVRSSISRLKRRGILEARRQDGAAGYALSEHARGILDEGDRRIFERPRASLQDGWVLAVFSVPESERQKRHMLRSRLSWLGFGTVSAGVWIAPGHLVEETRDVLARHDLEQYVDLFHSDYLGPGDVREQVSQWWDLDELQTLYEDFHEAWSPVLRRWRRRTDVDVERSGEAFADYVRALTSWRRLPFLDPGLPPELLPKGWLGVKAADLFFDLKERVEKPAHTYVETVTGR
jgi:phenylacetic acid degradation operon negative regulatory protein